MSILKKLHFKMLPILIGSLILVGCGQKGPLTLPKPQFPAPPEEPESNPQR